MKTNKSAKKRLRVTKKKKVLHRPPHQNHFNAKDTGDETRQKRGKSRMPRTEEKKILEQYLPGA